MNPRDRCPNQSVARDFVAADGVFQPNASYSGKTGSISDSAGIRDYAVEKRSSVIRWEQAKDRELGVVSVFRRKSQSLRAHSWFVLVWFPFAFVVLGIVRMSINLLTFKSLERFLGQPFGDAPAVPVIRPEKNRRVRQIARLVTVSSRNVFWTSNCFDQAVLCRIMLGIYGLPYTLFFGVRRSVNTTGEIAHAWVCSGKFCVSGGYGFDDYATVQCYGLQSWRKS